MQKKYELETFQDGDDVVIQLPPELCDEMKWRPGDMLEWHDNKDGSFSLNKVVKKTEKETELVLVETVLSYHMKYVVEVPVGKSDWALDTVVCEQAKEFSQRYIGEDIVTSRVISKEEAIEMCNIDNSYCADWPEERKIKAFFTPQEGVKN